MSTSQITKAALRQSLKQLMKKYSMNKITVKMITDGCGLTRNTFYNHFADVYDVLESIFKYEVILELEQCRNLERWKDGLLLMLHYALSNRVLCMNTYRSMGREYMECSLYTTFRKLVKGVIEDICCGKLVDESLKRDLGDFFAFAITGQFMAWMSGGLKESPQEFVNRVSSIMEGAIIYLLENRG